MKPTFKNKRSWLLGTAALALAVSSPAYAQEAVAEEDETATLDVVKVTGIRGSIQDSLAAKRNATSIVEVISAEDIGKLPDLSIADSLARLPGVTAQRVRGRAQSVSIRGLGPSFSLALLNGREVVSANNNRGIEFDQFPSELIAQGVVYKSPDASIAATGIAGTVDLRTIKPLDYTDRKFNFSGKYVVNDNGSLNPDFDDNGYRLLGSYIDQNEAGTIGWYLAVTDQSNPTHFTSRELKTNGGQTAVTADGLVYPADNPRTGVVSREFKRTSVAGALQFEPTDRFDLTIDAFYNKTEDDGIFRGVETPIASWSNGVSLNNVTGTAPGIFDSATYDGVNVFARTDTESNTAETMAIGLNTNYQVTDNLRLTADFGYSDLDRNDEDYESYAGTGFNNTGTRDTLTFNYDTDGEYSIDHGLDYTAPGTLLLTDPGGWGQVGFLKQPIVTDELTQLRLEAEYDLNDYGFGVFRSLEGGYLSTDREKTFDSNESFLRASASFVNGGLPITNVVGSTDSGSIGLDIIAYDPSSFLSDGTYVVDKANFDAEWSVEESVDTFYLMANIDAQIGNIPVLGNIGFQHQETSQTSSSRGVVADYEYDDFLPSLNLSFEVAEDAFIRLGAGRTVTRPRMDDMAGGINLSTNGQVCADTDGDQAPDTFNAGAFDPTDPGGLCFYVNGGNPFLEPYRANSFDVSFEKYFDSTTSLAIAVFHKDLEDWIIEGATLVNVTGLVDNVFGTAGSSFVSANPAVATGRATSRGNFLDGEIQGLEITGNLGLDRFMPEPLAGFGLYGTVTLTDSSLTDPASGNDIDIPGYSDTTWATSVYYENHGWSSRLSARYRSEFQAEVPLFDGGLVNEKSKDETVFDFKAGYTFERDDFLDGVSLNFEVFNLTNEPYVTYGAPQTITGTAGTANIDRFISKHEEYGRTYNFTISKSF